MTDPQGVVQRLRDFLNAATPGLPGNHVFCRFGDADDRPLLAGGHPLLLGDIKHAIGQLDRLREWTATTEHGTAAAEILQLLDQPGQARPQPCGHGAEYHGPEVGCVECRCTSATGHN